MLVVTTWLTRPWRCAAGGTRAASACPVRRRRSECRCGELLLAGDFPVGH
jgi:hypothetical protein